MKNNSTLFRRSVYRTTAKGFGIPHDREKPILPPQDLRAREVLERYRGLVRPVGADEGGLDAAVEALLGPEADRTLAELAACGG